MAHILFNFRQLERPPAQRWRRGTTVGVGALGASNMRSALSSGCSALPRCAIAGSKRTRIARSWPVRSPICSSRAAIYCAERWRNLPRSTTTGCRRYRCHANYDTPTQREFSPHTRAKKLARAAECLVYSLTPSGVLAENHPKNRGFVGILRGQKCLRRRFSRRSPVGDWSRGARSMPRVFGRGRRSQPAALVGDRDDAALFPAIRILARYGSAKSGRARRVRAGSLGK